MKHKSEDYKISAVKYYLKNKVSMDKVCKIFECSKTSLKRWIDKYKLQKSITRNRRISISYKVTKEQVKYVKALQRMIKDKNITKENLKLYFKNQKNNETSLLLSVKK